MKTCNARIITVANGKGGTGKTSVNTFLGEFLYRQNQRVCYIDLDPNCCISEIYGQELQSQTTRLLLTGQDVGPYELKKNEAGGLLSIIPSELNLSMLANIKDTQLKFQLRRLNLAEQYDWIILDPPGNWNALTRNAIFAADSIIVAGKCSLLDLNATISFMNELKECCLESDVTVVCNAYNAAMDPHNIRQMYKKEFGEFLLDTPIPLMKSFQKLVFDPDYKVQTQIEKRLLPIVEAATGRTWGDK